MIVAQLTDSHLKADNRLAYQRVDTAAFLTRAVERINAFTPAVDAVIFSGDLTDTGGPGEYAALRTILDRLEAPLFAVPGNHDRRENLRAAFADTGFHVPGTPFCAGVAEDFPLRLIGLDSSVPGKPHGELGSAQLDWLAETLEARPDTPTLIFVHHPPFLTGIRHMDVQNLKDGEALIDLLERHYQVLHLACGHVHRAIETQLGCVAASIGPSPAHSVALDLDPDGPPGFSMEPPMLRLFRFCGGTVVSHLLFVDVPEGPFPFFDAAGKLID